MMLNRIFKQLFYYSFDERVTTNSNLLFNRCFDCRRCIVTQSFDVGLYYFRNIMFLLLLIIADEFSEVSSFLTVGEQLLACLFDFFNLACMLIRCIVALDKCCVPIDDIQFVSEVMPEHPGENTIQKL
ncbi:hypothetical protein C463_11252 [Halorubrum californiense DSM 19288]|uniref:Uncharacterized protein n=1 Tax=Halorubrum californiense DSM 19288 TaxID=1227465 RepID=M0E708_9EURY|nr:hypothetical protein C463_11252 [Halorubrum californiense DSM 19288]